MKIKFIIFLSMCLKLGAVELDQKSQEETFLVLNALMGDNASQNCEIYKKLFDETKKHEYLIEAVRNCYAIKDKDTKNLIAKADKILKDDPNFLRIKAANLVDNKDFLGAINTSKELIKFEPTHRNYAILGAIQAHIHDYENSLESYKKAYELDTNSDETLLKIAEIMINRLGNEQEAIRFLESDRKIKGCNEINCNILIDIYKNKREFHKAAELSQALFKATNEIKYIDNAWQLYAYIKDYTKATAILEKYSIDDKALVQIYVWNNDKKKAFDLAKKLWQNSGDKEYLAIMGILEYELNLPKISDEVLMRVIANFENSVEGLKNATYYNYYGYLLIDHELDIKKGMALVQKALNLEPKSPYFIDSMAWGYFKLGDCQKAGELFNTIDKSSDFFQKEEARDHIKAINDCIKGVK